VITLAISSLKGGVGKTTCAINLAFSVAKRGWKTILVDADPQGSISMSLSPEARDYAGLYELLNGSIQLEDAALKTKLPNLHIVMTGKVPIQDVSKWSSSLHDGTALKPFFQAVEEGGYDIAIIDTPSGLHGPTEGILRNCSHVVVPQQCEPLALRSLMLTVDFLDQLSTEDHEPCSLAGVILTMADPDLPESRHVAEEIRRILPPELVCQAFFPRDAAIVNASMRGMPLGLLRGEAPPSASILFDQLAAELETKLGLTKPEEPEEYISLVEG
jgi:chromosome partitioning protein